MRASLSLPIAPPGPDALPFGGDKPWLAPLAGVSDISFRLLCREYGAACCVTEMVSARGLVHRGSGTARLLATVAADQPLVVQLFGADPECLRRAVAMLRELGYRWFDLNMGCSVPKVLRQGAGAALLADIPRCLAVSRAMIAEAEPGHVGFKLRLGMDCSSPVLPDLARRLEDLGCGWIALHPRYARQGFGGKADREPLARLSEILAVPLLASGDLFSAEDGVRCLRETGVAGVMYARGAIRNPAVFAEHLAAVAGRVPSAGARPALGEVVRRHLSLVRECSPRRGVRQLRGVLAGYVRELPEARLVRAAICRCVEWEELRDVVDTWLPVRSNGRRLSDRAQNFDYPN